MKQHVTFIISRKLRHSDTLNTFIYKFISFLMFDECFRPVIWRLLCGTLSALSYPVDTRFENDLLYLHI